MFIPRLRAIQTLATRLPLVFPRLLIVRLLFDIESKSYRLILAKLRDCTKVEHTNWASFLSFHLTALVWSHEIKLQALLLNTWFYFFLRVLILEARFSIYWDSFFLWHLSFSNTITSFSINAYVYLLIHFCKHLSAIIPFPDHLYQNLWNRPISDDNCR